MKSPIDKRQLKAYRYHVSYGEMDYGACVYKGRSRKPIVRRDSLCGLVFYLATLGLTIGENHSIKRKEG